MAKISYYPKIKDQDSGIEIEKSKDKHLPALLKVKTQYRVSAEEKEIYRKELTDILNSDQVMSYTIHDDKKLFGGAKTIGSVFLSSINKEKHIGLFRFDLYSRLYKLNIVKYILELFLEIPKELGYKKIIVNIFSNEEANILGQIGFKPFDFDALEINKKVETCLLTELLSGTYMEIELDK